MVWAGEWGKQQTTWECECDIGKAALDEYWAERAAKRQRRSDEASSASAASSAAEAAEAEPSSSEPSERDRRAAEREARHAGQRAAALAGKSTGDLNITAAERKEARLCYCIAYNL